MSKHSATSPLISCLTVFTGVFGVAYLFSSLGLFMTGYGFFLLPTVVFFLLLAVTLITLIAYRRAVARAKASSSERPHGAQSPLPSEPPEEEPPEEEPPEEEPPEEEQPNAVFKFAPACRAWLKQIESLVRDPKSDVSDLRFFQRDINKVRASVQHSGLRVLVTIEHFSSGDHWYERLNFEAPIRPMLNLGLLVRGANTSSNELAFDDDDEFAGAFSVFAFDETRARALLSPGVRRRLVNMGGHCKLTDRTASFSISISTGWPEERQLDAGERLHDVASFTRLLRREADGLGIADRFSSQLATWQTLSSERNWSLTETPLRITGRVAGGWVTLGMVLRNPDPSPMDTSDCFYERRARLRFDEPLGLGLQLRGANTSRQWQDRLSDPLGRRTVQTGDAAFDETFAVQADDLEGGKKLLDENVRKMLLKVHQTMDPVWLDDESIELRDPNPETSGDELPRLVPALEELAQVIQETRTKANDRTQGPYR